ncbi:hypothetical protein [Trebonia sp.]|uniref:hypothetical protein n=1 Tax=Trebonia sp. TaxID=2767075 RepID=UPI002608F183|nr:hypothetical protein [Trebonia sp.]
MLVIVTCWPAATGTTELIVLTVVPSPAAVVTLNFQVLPWATGNGTEASETTPLDELEAAGVVAEAVEAEVAVLAADVAGVLLPELAAEPQPASASPVASTHTAAAAAMAIVRAPGVRRARKVSMLIM